MDDSSMHRSLTLEDDAPLPAARLNTASEATERLFVAHGRFVLRVLLRMGVAEQDARDLGQEVFLTVFRKHGEFLGDSRETTWLYGICLRVAANYRRKGHRRLEQLHAAIPVTAPAHEQGHEHEIDARRLMCSLDAALERLPPKKRDVFVLYEFAEREMEEISEILGAPLKTCYSRLYAAREELKADLARQRAKEARP
jgi:RNA polymerase sigma-70 factor (ECF subfamily)